MKCCGEDMILKPYTRANQGGVLDIFVCVRCGRTVERSISNEMTIGHEDASPGWGATPAPRKCRVCGCTDSDCSQCIEKTGAPCYWVEYDLCSACVVEAEMMKRGPVKR